ncbi:MAG: hypothetical protein WA102_07910 [Candidatus Methanoperedens sp.]
MKLLSSETAASEVIGHILILFITILGVGMIALYGVPAIYSLEDMANSKNTEQAFTVLDSRASRVTLGESPLQVTNINLGGGTMTVEPNSSTNPSYMVVNSSSFNVTIPMGRVKYTLGDRIVAYEGGGVWAQYAGGGTVMLSPPEIHYNGWTLTLPVINVSGSASVGGKGTAVVSFKKMATIIQYPNASIAGRTNPVNGSDIGKVNVNITSDYYKAWADYARTLSYTNISVNDTGKTAIIELEVTSPMGTFSLPGQIVIRNVNTSNPTPLNNFSVNLFSTAPTDEIKLELEVKNETGYEFKIDLHRDGNGVVDIEVKYEGKNPNPDEEWKYSYTDTSYPFNFDFLNRSMNLTYDDSHCSQTWTPQYCKPPIQYNQTSLYNIIEHYFQLLGTDFTIKVEHENHVDYSRSTYTLNYDPGPGALTYLHITENRADVGIS